MCMNFIEIIRIINYFFLVCRVIGLLCKSVICFDLVYDIDGSMIIDYVFICNVDGYLKRDRDRIDDFIW